MRRRKLVALLGGSTVTEAFAALAQERPRLRRIGVLSGFAETDREAQVWDMAFRKRLGELGWTEGRTVQLDYRWAAGSLDRLELFAKELVQLAPNVLIGVSTAATAALQRQTRDIPIVFAVVSDPIGSGFVASLNRPGGNITGFINLESSLIGKWLGLLREIAPQVSRVACMFNPKTASYARYYLETFKSLAATLAIEPIEAMVASTAEIDAAMTTLGGQARAGLLVMPDAFMQLNRATVISLAARYRLPTVYPFRFFTADKGLISYGVDLADSLRGAASYADRIFQGAKPDELPVQLPTKFELIVNLKTAREIGIDIPPALIARADEVIE
jgi:putative tryptophan/tyrosine transport system substrate-binding protein